MSERDLLPKNFCPLPFTQLFLYPTGEVFPCCESSYKVGDLRESSLAEIWNSPAIQSLREEFLTGKTTTCAAQIKHKHCHLMAERLLASTVPSKVQKEPVRAFDLILNGKCNLECVMCPVWTMPNQVYDSTSFWEEGEQGIFAQLEQISVKSGEPFIQRDTFRLIDRVSSVNPGCRWTLTTNGQYKLTPFILSQLDRIAIDSIKVSIDSLVPEVYSRIRLRGDLKKVLRTLDDLISYRLKRLSSGRGFHLGVNMAVQQLNRLEPSALVQYCEDRGIEPIFLYVFTPDRESISSLPEEERASVLERYLSYLESRPEYLTHLGTVVIPILNSLPEKEKASAALRWKRLTLSALFQKETKLAAPVQKPAIETAVPSRRRRHIEVHVP